MIVEKCYCPASIEEAVTLLAHHCGEMQICAGGTDLFVMMRKGKSQCRYLLDISGLNLASITKKPDGTISIGAGVTLSEVQRNEYLSHPAFQALQKAARHVGSLQIRNMATLVGNICTGITSADTAVPLLALDAHVKLVSKHGSRILPLTEFFIKPRQTAVESDELVTEIILKDYQDTRCQSYFRKVGTRKELLISIFNAAALLFLADDGTVRSAMLAMGVVAPIPIRLLKTEAFLTGKKMDNEVVEKAVAIMQEEIHPRSSFHGSEEYRRLLAANILREFLTDAHQNWLGR